MNTVCIDLTFSGISKMPDTVMNGIEKSFSIERTALEYDGNPNHRTEIIWMKLTYRQSGQE